MEARWTYSRPPKDAKHVFVSHCGLYNRWEASWIQSDHLRPPQAPRPKMFILSHCGPHMKNWLLLAMHMSHCNERSLFIDTASPGFDVWSPKIKKK